MGDIAELLNFQNWMQFPVGASEHSRQVDHFILWVHWLMAALFIGWMGYFVLALVKFRKSRHPKADYVGLTGSKPKVVEALVIVAEVILLFFLAIPAWTTQVETKKFPDRNTSTVLRVTAEQFSWTARYTGADHKFGRQDRSLITGANPIGLDPNDANGKDDFTSAVNDIKVPVGKPVIVELTSKDVIHSFAIAPLRVCQDAIPGMMIPIHFTPTKEGRYLITCAQLCGNSHAYMLGHFTVMSQKDYAKWESENMAAAAKGPVSFE